MRPPPRAAMRGAAARISRIGPRTCRSYWPRQSSSVSSSSGAGVGRARVVDQHADAAERLGARDDPLGVLGLGDVGGERLAADARAAAAASASASRPTSSTRAPSAASRRAVSRPMPLLAPVTTHTVPVSPRSIAASSQAARRRGLGGALGALRHIPEDRCRTIGALDALHPLSRTP